MVKQPRDWTPNQPLTTGRLAWLAARDELRRRSSPWWLVFVRVASGRTTVGTGISRSYSSEVVSDKLSSYARPVDAVAERLSPSEAAALRERGELPEWFFNAVEQERKHPGSVYR